MQADRRPTSGFWAIRMGWLRRHGVDVGAPTASNTRPAHLADLNGQVAQLVEQRTENPRVDSSILSLATIPSAEISRFSAPVVGTTLRSLCRICLSAMYRPNPSQQTSNLRQINDGIIEAGCGRRFRAEDRWVSRQGSGKASDNNHMTWKSLMPLGDSAYIFSTGTMS